MRQEWWVEASERALTTHRNHGEDFIHRNRLLFVRAVPHEWVWDLI